MITPDTQTSDLLFPITCPGTFLNPKTLEKYQAPSYQVFLQKHEQTFRQLNKILKGKKPQKVCIEGGHIYSDKEIQNQHLDQLTYLVYLKQWLAENKYSADLMLFVDDFHPDPNTHIFDLAEYEKLAKHFGLEFEHVVSEKSLTHEATQLGNTLPTTQIQSDTKKRISLVGANGPVIFTEGQEPSCALMDSQLSLMKKEEYDLTINLLPRPYKKEQANTRKILAALGYQAKNFIFTFLTK